MFSMAPCGLRALCTRKVSHIKITLPSSNLNSFPADPLFVFAFIHTLLDVLQEYLGEVSAGTIRDNFDVVYQVGTLWDRTEFELNSVSY